MWRTFSHILVTSGHWDISGLLLGEGQATSESHAGVFCPLGSMNRWLLLPGQARVSLLFGFFEPVDPTLKPKHRCIHSTFCCEEAGGRSTIRCRWEKLYSVQIAQRFLIQRATTDAVCFEGELRLASGQLTLFSIWFFPNA